MTSLSAVAGFSRMRRGLAFAVVAVVVAMPLDIRSVLAQTPSMADVAAISGSDRLERLIAGAKKEGELVYYSSATISDINAIVGPFEKKYGIKVRIWRGSTQDILQRTMTENRSGRATVDAIETSGLTMEALHRENLLQAMNPPALADLMPQAVPPHHEWVATRLNIFASFYNTNLILPADVPKSYQDLDNPKWKGKLGVEVESIDWFSTVVGKMGEEAGLKLFRDIVSKNGVSVRKGHTLLANLTASGEVPFAITTYEYRDQQLIDEGAPVKVLYLPPVVALPTGVGLTRNAPHPYAAALFEDFILTDGQAIYNGRKSFPTNPKIRPPPPGVELTFVDFSKLLDENDKWTKLYKQIFIDQSR